MLFGKFCPTTSGSIILSGIDGICEQKLNSISVKFELGTFLKNFYIPSFHTSPYLSVVRSKTRIYLSEKDNWYPTRDNYSARAAE